MNYLFDRLVQHELDTHWYNGRSIARTLVRWKLTALTLATLLVALAIAGAWR